MTSPVLTVDADERLARLSQIFSEKQLHHLLVVDEDRFVGVISDRDFYKSIGPRAQSQIANSVEAAALNKRAHQVMSRHPICVREHQSVEDVMDLLIAHQISCVPVVNSQNFPIGIISWRDVIKLLREND
ncbi:CBS domain-containing protein [Zhongshania aliphaticivorans]|nr:CBS domain-containing protein [Zhongshania aliphaticivorans]